MKKKVMVLTMLAFMLVFAAACGNNTESASEQKPKATPSEEKEVAKDELKFPEKPVTLVVPYAAGGGTDATARALAKAAEEFLGQPIGVVNKTGGNAIVGMSEVASAKPDGYTLLFNTSEIVILPHQGMSPITYEDFAQIAQINFDPSALTVPADAPYNTLEEFLAYAKENPGKIRVGGSGTGGIWHLGSASIEKVTGVKLNYVPYDGGAPAKTALLGGHIEAVTISPAEVLTQVKAGELKTLAVLATDRSDSMPDVPTFNEAGYDVAVGVWRGIDAPAGTPAEVIEKLQEAFLKAAKEQEFITFMENNGLGIVLKGSEDYHKMVKKDNDFYKELLGELGLSN